MSQYNYNMFEYNPLLNTLKNKGKTFESMCNETGIKEGVIRQKLNGSENISLDVLDKICSNLECQPNDVILWKKGEMQSGERFHINWEKVTELCNKKNISLSSLSENCKLDRTALKKSMQRDSSVSHWILSAMCRYLECNQNEIIKI